MSVGKKLRSLRHKMKKTLKEQSQIFGVSLNSIYRWEHDLAAPRKAVLTKMAVFYDVPLSWLIDDTATVDGYEHAGYIPQPESGVEQQWLSMFSKLSDINKYKAIGYVERLCVEGM